MREVSNEELLKNVRDLTGYDCENSTNQMYLLYINVEENNADPKFNIHTLLIIPTYRHLMC